jgi:hypothetical protein
MHLRQGSNELDSSSPPARSSPVILSAAKDLAAHRVRPFVALRVISQGSGDERFPSGRSQATRDDDRSCLLNRIISLCWLFRYPD